MWSISFYRLLPIGSIPWAVAKFLGPDWGDIVDSGIYRVAVQARKPICSLAGRYDNPMLEMTLSFQSETKNFATALFLVDKNVHNTVYTKYFITNNLTYILFCFFLTSLLFTFNLLFVMLIFCSVYECVSVCFYVFFYALKQLAVCRSLFTVVFLVMFRYSWYNFFLLRETSSVTAIIL